MPCRGTSPRRNAVQKEKIVAMQIGTRADVDEVVPVSVAVPTHIPSASRRPCIVILGAGVAGLTAAAAAASHRATGKVCPSHQGAADPLPTLEAAHRSLCSSIEQD